MQHCVPFPLHAVAGFFMAAHCSAFVLENPAGVRGIMPSTLVSSDVEYAKGLTECPKGVLADESGTCFGVRLVLDIYAPGGTLNSRSNVPGPAILIAHGGANTQGDKRFAGDHAHFFAEHGYVAFVPNYRLSVQNGTFPGEDFNVEKCVWRSLYPAVRDLKASFRYIVANADAFGVDRSRITAFGVSAGAMDVLAAFAANNNSQFTTEFSPAEDPTLRTVHADVPATAHAIIMKSGSAWGLEAYAKYSGEPAPWQVGGAMNAVGVLPPLLQIHGTEDELIPFENAPTTAQHWKTAGARNCLVALDGGTHESWESEAGPADASTYDSIALAFLAALEDSSTLKCPVAPKRR